MFDGILGNVMWFRLEGTGTPRMSVYVFYDYMITYEGTGTGPLLVYYQRSVIHDEKEQRF